MEDDDGWFPVDVPPVGAAAEFLGAARAAAASWRSIGAEPADTDALPHLDGFVVEVTIPGVTSRWRTLRVMYTPPGPDPLAPLLQAELGEDLASEDGAHPFDNDDPYPLLHIVGLSATPGQCGIWAAEWLEAQLQRPIVRREWDRPAGAVAALLPTASGSIAAVEWWFVDPEQRIDIHQSPAWWWWLVKRPPDREVTERPDRRSDHRPT